MPDTLTWQVDEEVFDRVYESWVAVASDALGAVLGRLHQRDSTKAAELASRVGAMSNEAIERLLLAPETTSRLISARPKAVVEEICQFLHRSVLAELAGIAAMAPPKEEIWTALGDGHVGADGSLLRGPRLLGLMPLDFGSPYSRYVDLTGARDRIPHPRLPLSEDEINGTLQQLQRMHDGLRKTSELIMRFVVRFTRVLILQRDDREPFSSGSNGDYIGRSVISNPHLASDAQLADAVVHEAIHSLLYIQEKQQPWVLDAALYDPVPRVASPWTDRMLPLRPFLQACFVWYGLLNFWAAAGARHAFEGEQTRDLFRRAAFGFSRGSLTERLAPYREALSADILDCLEQMHGRVTTSLANLS